MFNEYQIGLLYVISGFVFFFSVFCDDEFSWTQDDGEIILRATGLFLIFFGMILIII